AVEAPAAAPAEGSVPSPAPATTSTPPARDSAFYEQQELRLRALTRLRDQGLITPQEFEAKRRAIVDAL
ncbi:MAG: SHOCT domain-containing protein, partial [Burkholderiales bacterium]|nr:SHOCT domain-containing protein [Burkholderiales bacterium]